MGKCDSCKNKGTAWCRGCEHRYPGLDQFDFYQRAKLEDSSNTKSEEAM